MKASGPLSEITFSKLEATGNDFVVIDQDGEGVDVDVVDNDGVALSIETRRWLCDRHRGVGADGVLTILPARTAAASAGARSRMHITNPDGSVPEMCGNGLRCVARHLAETGRIGTGVDVAIDTDAGVRVVNVADDFGEVTIDMGAADFQSPRQFTPAVERTVLPEDGPGADDAVVGRLSTTVSMGNPHLVIEADVMPDAAAAGRAGRALELWAARFPERTNIEWVVDRDDGSGDVDVVVWERGAGLTQACGTGACAVAAALVKCGRRAPGVVVCHLPGGPLRITVTSLQAPISMTGPVTRAFDGVTRAATTSTRPVG